MHLANITAPEVRRGESFDAYTRIAAVNISSLLHMRTSPLHYRHYRKHGREDTDAMRLGRATHTAILEPDKFETEYIEWTGARRAGGKWDDFEAAAANAGKTILRAQDYDVCMTMRDAVRAHPVARAYLDEPGGERELTLLWRDAETGLACKVRLDLRCSDIVDLKTSLHAEPFQFGRQAANLAYHLRAAFYVDAHLAVTGEAKQHAFISVEKSAPHDVVVYSVPDDIIEIGRGMYRPLLQRAAECYALDHWPGVAESEAIDLRLPSWAMATDTPDTLIVGGEEVSL